MLPPARYCSFLALLLLPLVPPTYACSIRMPLTSSYYTLLRPTRSCSLLLLLAPYSSPCYLQLSPAPHLSLRLVTVPYCSFLLTLAPSCSILLLPAHSCSLLLPTAPSCSLLLPLNPSFSLLLLPAHSCSLLLPTKQLPLIYRKKKVCPIIDSFSIYTCFKCLYAWSPSSPILPVTHSI